VILSLPEEVLFAWCHAHPDAGPAFVASVAPVLTSQRRDAADRKIHRVLLRTLDEFGDRDDVRSAITANMNTFGWSGSLADYYDLYEQPLGSLLEHPIGAVRRWAQVALSQMRGRAETARADDDEQDAHWNA
jgi:hypothetical protein